MSTMLYDIAIVEDRGTYYRVTSVTQNTLDGQAYKNELYVNMSYVAGIQVKEAILAGKIVNIRKPLNNVELLPGEYDILDPLEIDELQANKDGSLVRVRMLINPILSKISGFALYGFTVLNNDLASAGYFITNDNREEKYLEILETGDEKLIAKLEDYLNYKDEIENIAFLERKFSAFREEIKKSQTIDQVNELTDKFLESFYAKY